MGLRPDEIFVTNCLVNYFGGSDVVTVNDGDDPPDVYLTIGESAIAVEISQLTPVMILSDGSIENRTTPDISGISLLDKLDQEFREQLNSVSLLIHLKLPVPNYNEFKKGLRNTLISLISASIPDQWQEYDVAGNMVGVTRTETNLNSEKRIIGFVENIYSNPSIAMNAEAILLNRIETKELICSEISWTGERWLALLNRYWLADIDSYRRAYNSTKTNHNFSKILYISGSGSVHELYNET